MHDASPLREFPLRLRYLGWAGFLSLSLLIGSFVSEYLKLQPIAERRGLGTRPGGEDGHARFDPFYAAIDLLVGAAVVAALEWLRRAT